MNQKEEINNIMLKLQKLAKIPNGVFIAEEIEKVFRNYGLSPNMINMAVSEQAKKEIYDMLMWKMDENKCSFDYNPLTEGWTSFRTNQNTGIITNSKWKVYIPIKPEHYGFAVNNIIAFLCDNGIKASCKVSGTLSNDSLIVNLENDEDVTKLNTYIDKYKSIKNCLGKHHPFIPDWNGIGVVHGNDKDTSYTQRLSSYLAHYLNVCKAQGRLECITAEGFLNSMKEALDNGKVQKPWEIKQLIEHMDIIMNGKTYNWDDNFSQEVHHKR